MAKSKEKKLERRSFKVAAIEVIKSALGSTKKTLRLVLIIVAIGAAYGIYKYVATAAATIVK